MPRLAKALLIAIAAAAGIWVGLMLNRPKAERTAPTDSTQADFAGSGQQSDASLAAAALAPSPQAAASPASAEGSIEGERIFTFADDAAFHAFVAAARDAGLQVAAVNRPLRSARLRFASATDAQRADLLAGPEARSEPNFTVLIPLPVSPEQGAQGQPFAASALAYLGVPTDNANWGRGVTIAVLDTGALEHTSLQGAKIERLDLIDSPDGPATDLSPHGTAVASLIVGQLGNGIAPEANLLSIRVLDSDGIGDSFTLAQGIVEAVDRGAHVISMSLGGFGYSETLASAVDYAASKGVVLVAAVGNEGVAALPYPANFDNVVAVSAVDANGAHAPFSNQGAQVDIAAPGVGLYSAWNDESWVSFTGTSAAAPLIAGGIAALTSQIDGLSPSEAAQRLLRNANDAGLPGADGQLGAGIADLSRSLRSEQPGIVDLAVADIYVEPEMAASERSTIHITAQNRGTATLAVAALTITLANGNTLEVNLGRLQPGEVASYPLVLDSLQLESASGYAVSAESRLGASAIDQHPENDRLSTVLRLVPDP